ncbi:MAG: Oligopeptide transport ATP-binding protein OppF [Alphaproteobacteria bacterium MarineAlpha9_Bin6]|nr:MAG: Oligopeptide transport ATP-binding protein OppF [Alphaproteobacteria bacterium MarineAlpha9_Bin6]
MSQPEPVLVVEDLKVEFPVHGGLLGGRRIGTVKAVDGVSFEVNPGETLGVVGESGCGKTTMGLAILRMIDITSGRIVFDGEDISTLERAAMRPVRRKMQMVYQDPFGALDPRMRAKDIIGEPLVAHGISENREAYRERVSELLEMVGLDVVMGERYPHEFSGGQRQRIGIARALALRPTLVVCDEPVSALDVSIQAQIINLLEALQDELGLTYLFIAHDLSVVQHISDRVMVMYLGKVVEIANRSDLYRAPKHPYTQALLSAVPMPSPDAEAAREVVLLEGEVPSPLNPPTGCPFHPRCSMARPDCRETMPVLTEQNTGHKVACHLY